MPGTHPCEGLSRGPGMVVGGAPRKEHAPGKRASYKSLVLSFSLTGAGDWPSLQSTGQQDTPPGRQFPLWVVEGALLGPRSALVGAWAALIVAVASAERAGAGVVLDDHPTLIP